MIRQFNFSLPSSNIGRVEVTDECREKALTGEESHYAQQLEEDSAASAARSLGILSSDKLNRLLQVMCCVGWYIITPNGWPVIGQYQLHWLPWTNCD